MNKEDLEHLGSQVIGAGIEVHRHLGPGLLESVYESCLAHELDLLGVHVDRQVTLPVEYKGHRFEQALRMDLVVQHEVVVEVKAVESLLPVHQAQLLSYLRLSRNRLGYLFNFNTPVLKDGIKRLVLDF